jgi:hypothetical protein
LKPQKEKGDVMKISRGIYIFVAIALVLALAGCTALPVVSEEKPSASSTAGEKIVIQLEDGMQNSVSKLTVTANGTVKVAPDVAYTTIGVVTQKKKMQDAQTANKELMNAVIAALKGSGLTDEDIRTINYSVYPVYDYSDGVSKINMFEVNNTVELTMRDIDKVGEYLDVAATAGANTSYSVRFDILDREPFYNQALTAAMESARAKADTMAAAGGCVIVKPVEVTEGYTYNTVYREYEMAAADKMDEGVTYVSAGQLDITATVSVIYEIE